MRPYQTEVVVQEKEPRTLDITLEREALPTLRVGVGCGDDQPLCDFGVFGLFDAAFDTSVRFGVLSLAVGACSGPPGAAKSGPRSSACAHGRLSRARAQGLRVLR